MLIQKLRCCLSFVSVGEYVLIISFVCFDNDFSATFVFDLIALNIISVAFLFYLVCNVQYQCHGPKVKEDFAALTFETGDFLSHKSQFLYVCLFEWLLLFSEKYVDNCDIGVNYFLCNLILSID